MRVVAGKYKRSNLLTLEGDSTRPTKDMVKEALFSTILIHNESTLLDLFAGSGSIGIEALSRGAKDVVFNDNNPAACNIIRNNLSKLNEKREVYNYNYDLLIERIKRKFDYIYLDPPYAFQYYDLLFELIEKFKILEDKGTIIVEIRKDVELKETYGSYKLFKERKYGITILRYYRKGEEND